MDNSPQGRFDAAYVTSTEICNELGISRSTLMHGRRRGMLPGAIAVGRHLYIWERGAVGPYVEAWRHSLACRAGGCKE